MRNCNSLCFGIWFYAQMDVYKYRNTGNEWYYILGSVVGTIFYIAACKTAMFGKARKEGENRVRRHIFWESLKIRKKQSVLLIIQCTLMFGLIIAIINIVSINMGKVKQLNQTTTTLNKLTDNFVLEEERKFFSQVDNVSLLKKFYEWEKGNSMWMYIIANRQNAGVVNKKLDAVFEYGYEVRQRTEGTYKSI